MKSKHDKTSPSDRKHLDSTAEDTLGTTAGDTEDPGPGEKPGEDTARLAQEESKKEKLAKVISITRNARTHTEHIPGTGLPSGAAADENLKGEGTTGLPAGSAASRTGLNSPGAGNTGKD